MFRSDQASALTGPMIDSATMLCPGLPPIFVPIPAVVAAARGGAAEGEPEQVLASLYRVAMLTEVAPDGVTVPNAEGGEGVALVREIVRARAGTSEERTAARALLRDRMERDLPGWMESWCRVGLGRSLLREADDESRLLAVAELLRVPALLSDEVPYLTGIALGEAAVALDDRGDAASAVRLRAEIIETLPGHPVLDWARLKTVGMKRTGVGTDPAGTDAGGSH